MESKIDFKKIAIVLIFALVLALAIFFILKGKDLNEEDKQSMSNKEVNQQLIDKVKEIKEQNQDLVLEYETTNIPEITSFVYKDGDNYKSIIIDNNKASIVTFEDLVKDSEKENFNNKELELLRLKYPTFIVDDIIANKEDTGHKFYYLKENEMIIYYYDYQISYNYQEPISLIINYQEVKDYLNFTPIFDETYENESGYNYQSDRKSIALTIDDGPNSRNNARFLELLSDNKAHATFFMAGNMMNACQKCVLDTYNSGNEIGSHTYEHMNIKKNSQEAVLESLRKTNDLFHQITNDDIKLLRPPYGAYNAENRNYINMPFILWNMDTEDWLYRDTNHIVDYIRKYAKDGSVILIHESYKETVAALEIILPELYAKGYQVVSISELASLKGVTLENGVAYNSFK